VAPSESFTSWIRFHVTPPSFDSQIPNFVVSVGLVRRAPPRPRRTAASTWFASFGSTMMRLIATPRKYLSSEMCDQVLPPSVDLSTPSPKYESPERAPSPVPA
jgi:hypothetical protein